MEGYARVVLVTMVVAGLFLGSGPFVANGQLCGMSKEGFKACEPSVSSANPNPSPPSSACCMALDDANLQCLCFFKDSKLLNDYNIDFSRAIALPKQCNLMKSFHCQMCENTYTHNFLALILNFLSFLLLLDLLCLHFVFGVFLSSIVFSNFH